MCHMTDSTPSDTSSNVTENRITNEVLNHLHPKGMLTDKILKQLEIDESILLEDKNTHVEIFA